MHELTQAVVCPYIFDKLGFMPKSPNMGFYVTGIKERGENLENQFRKQSLRPYITHTMFSYNDIKKLNACFLDIV